MSSTPDSSDPSDPTSGSEDEITVDPISQLPTYDESLATVKAELKARMRTTSIAGSGLDKDATVRLKMQMLKEEEEKWRQEVEANGRSDLAFLRDFPEWTTMMVGDADIHSWEEILKAARTKDLKDVSAIEKDRLLWLLEERLSIYEDHRDCAQRKMNRVRTMIGSMAKAKVLSELQSELDTLSSQDVQGQH